MSIEPIRPLSPPDPPQPSPSSVPIIEFRELAPDEIRSIEPVFRANNRTLPDPRTSKIIGAIQGSSVLAFVTLETYVHSGTWIGPGHSQLFPRLASAAGQALLSAAGPQWVYVITSNDRVAELARAIGFLPEPGRVLVKLVAPEIPGKPTLDLLSEAPKVNGQVQIPHDPVPVDPDAELDRRMRAALLLDQESPIQ
jgi:hypothetical protein